MAVLLFYSVIPAYSQNVNDISVFKWLIFFNLLFFVVLLYISSQLIKYYKNKYRSECENKLRIKEKLYLTEKKPDTEHTVFFGGNAITSTKK